MADQEQHTGGMIALVPIAEDAEKLAVGGGEDVGELHLTLTYLGDDVSTMEPETRSMLLSEVATMAASMTPIEAEVMGHATFNPKGGEREPCAVYLVSGTVELPLLHDDLGQYAGEDEHPVFLPHITAGYGVDSGTLDYVGPVTFDRIRVALGEHVTDIAFSGEPEEDELDDDESLDAEDEGDEDDDVAYGADEDDEDVEEKAAADEREKREQKPRDPKMTVASQAGVRRYGLPIGTDLGNPRDAKAREAQRSEKGRSLYERMMKMPMAKRATFVNRLSDEDLEALTRITYSFRTSDNQVVGARNVMASALGKRGKDVRDFGALGGGKGGGTRSAKAGSVGLKDVSEADWDKMLKAGWKGRAGDSEERLYPPSGGVKLGSVPEKIWDKLLAAGWKGRPGDKEERLYPPPAKKKAPAKGRESRVQRTAGGSSRSGGGSGGSGGKGPTWVGNEDWQERRARRMKLGLQGRPGTPAPKAKTKRGEGGRVMTLQVYEDGSWQYI